MKQSENNRHEILRIKELYKYEILDTDNEKEFDDIVKLTAQICAVPVAMIYFNDIRRIWFKAKVGFSLTEISSENIQNLQSGNDLVEISDFQNNNSFKRTAFAEAFPEYDFLAKVDLLTPEGFSIGSLCVMDKNARDLSETQRNSLRLLAEQVITILELRLSRVNSKLTIWELSALKSSHAVIEFNKDGIILDANEKFLNIFGYKIEEVLHKHHNIFVPFNYSRSLEYAEFWRKLANGDSINGEFMRISKAESEVWIQASYNPVYDENRNLLKIIKIATDITRGKNILIDAQQRVQAMSVSSAIIEFDLNGYIIAANENYARIVGYTQQQLVGYHHSIFISKEVKESPQYRDFWKNLNQGISQTGIFERITKQGQTIFVRGTYSTLFDANGSPYKVIKYAHDFTEEHVSNLGNNEIKISVDRSTSFVEFDLSGHIVSANENFLKLMKYSKDEIIGNHQSIFMPDDVLFSEEYKNFWDKLSSGQFQSGDYMWINKYRKPVWVRSSYNPIFDTSGKPYKILQFAFDITENKTSEQNAKKTEEQLRLLNLALEHQKQALDCSAIVAETDSHGRITYVNNKFLEISKYTEEELLGHDHRILNSGYHSKEFFKDLWNTISEGKVWRSEVKNKAKDGTYYWVDTTIYPVIDEVGKVQKYVAIRYDITDKKRAFEEIQQANEKVIKAAEAKTEFLANMSHEIRTPMNAIIGMTELLRETSLNSDQNRYVNVLNNSGVALLDVINNILDLSKIESGHVEIEQISYNLEDLISDVVEMISYSAYKKGLELVISIEQNLRTHLIGDPARLKQVLINLLNNAIKFTKSGEIVLSVKKNENRFLYFEIKDTGIGIPAEKLGKLFRNFSQVNTSVTREYGGTGLGLAISKKIVELIGGSIDVKSEVDKGTIFFFQIPYHIDSAIIESSFNKSLLKGKRILVIDDNSSCRENLSNILSFWGALVEEAASLEAGIENVTVATNKNQEYDIVFIDYSIPNTHGIDSVADFKKTTSFHKPVICMLTEDESRSRISRKKDHGFLILKPIRSKELLDVTLKALTNEHLASVLVVDDDDEICNLISELLAPLNLKVITAGNGMDAYKKLKEEQFKLIISDIKMPVMDGMQFLEKIRKDDIDTPFMFLSGYLNRTNLNKAGFGDIESIEKPFDISYFQKKVQGIIASDPKIQKLKNAVTLTMNDSANKFKILVVDDVSDNIMLIQQYLKKLPYVLDIACSGKEAIDKFSQDKYDLIFMDIQMPEMDGYEVTQRIRQMEMQKNLPHTIIISLSAHALSEERQMAFESGMDDCIVKPVKKALLIDTIKKYENLTVITNGSKVRNVH